MPVTRNQSNAAANAKSNAATTDTSGPRENTERGEASTEAEPSRRDSPENCSICLGPFNNKSFTSSCAHSFCFVCLKQWSKVKAECPLCKQPFTSIFHNIRSNDSYDIYELPPLNPPRQIDYSYFYNYMGGNLNTFAPTHHYLSLPQPSLDADLTLSNFSRFQFRHRRYDRYLNPLHPVHGEHQYSYTSSSFHPSTHVSAASWARGAEDFRLRVYRHHMGPPAVILGCENSTYRLTPAMVAASPHRMQRIMPWLTRELCVLLKSHQSVRLAISMIQPLLTQVTIDSEYFSERISPLIGQRARHFILEFVAFTNSALNMQAFDRKAMYRRRVARFMDEEDTSSSSSDDDDDVVEVTDVSPDVQVSSLIVPSSNTSTSLQRSGWDSPTPGPSWETHIPVPHIESDRVSISSESEDPVFRPDLNDSDSDNSQAGSDIVFVKYDKPWNERSPIKLSSGSEGERRSRKRKKVKHKKRRKEIPDIQVGLAGKGKGHKTSKSKSKEKVRESKASSEEDCQTSTTHKRAHSAVSSDKQKKKKHKRSKDRNVDDVGHDRDRELVDRLFVEALTQQQNLQTIESEDPSIPCSSKSKDKNAGKSSGKDRHKRKKKKKNQDRDSVSPSILQPYKKHHSGHKKSLDKSSHDPERRRHQHRRIARKTALAKYSSRTESLEREMQVARNQPLPPSNVDHSMASTFQTSYLTRTDTVQHIPLNLWVSTWPSLPVSHTFPAPPSSSFPPPSLPQPLASSSLPSHNLNHSISEHNSSAVNSQTISSESESSSDSDTDDSPEKGVSTLLNCTRTKQWLDANFSDVGRQPTTISMLQTVSTAPNITRNWGIENITGQNNTSTGPSDDIADVVSIGSGDEDIVVCSSASSTKSDSDEVKVIESCDLPVDSASDVTSVSRLESFATTSSICTSALRENAGIDSIPALDQVNRTKPHCLSNQNVSPPSCNSFQPFKLHRKSALTKQSVNPFFSSMAQNSDDDGTGETDISNNPPQSSDHEKLMSVEVLSGSIQDATRNHSYHEFKTASTSSRLESSTSPHVNTFPQMPSSIFESPVKVNSTVSIIASGNSHRSHSGNQDVSPSSFSLSSSTSEPVFSVLPPLQATTTAPVSSILPSSLNYFPYSSLSMPSSLSSILPQSLPFVVPQAPAPPGLPLHFSFPPIQPIIPGPSTLFPTVFVSYSQTAQIATTVSGSALSSERDSKPTFPPMTAGSKFPLDIQNKQNECLTEDGVESSTSGIININSACPQNSFSTSFTQDNTQVNITGPSSSEETFDQIKIMLTSENSKPLPSSLTQDLCNIEYNESCLKNIDDFLEVENAGNSCSTSAGDIELSAIESGVECTSDSNKSIVEPLTNSSENSPDSGCDATTSFLKEDTSNSQCTSVSYNDIEQHGTSNSEHTTGVWYNDIEQLGTSNSQHTSVCYNNEIEQLETSNSQHTGVCYNSGIEQLGTSNSQYTGASYSDIKQHNIEQPATE